jgi:N utilization substance protein B
MKKSEKKKSEKKGQSQFEPRRRARRRALQALYQWHMTGNDEAEIVLQFVEEQNFENVDQEWFRILLAAVISTHEVLDGELQTFLDRPIKQLDIMELLILRMSAYELLNHAEIPFRVVIDEAVDLALRFGADQGHSFINGVLDNATRKWRKEERAAASENSA